MYAPKSTVTMHCSASGVRLFLSFLPLPEASDPKLWGEAMSSRALASGLMPPASLRLKYGNGKGLHISGVSVGGNFRSKLRTLRREKKLSWIQVERGQRAISVRSVMDSLQPLYAKALENLPDSTANLLKGAVGEQLNVVSVVLASVVVFLSILVPAKLFSGKMKNLPPTIPGGWPILGNILQLGEKKPHRTFTKWVEKYGPIFHVKTGAINNVVISSALLAKEVMVTKFDKVSTRRMSTALRILTADKKMVAMSDYGEEHLMLKKLAVGNLLGLSCQRANRSIREEALSRMIDDLFAQVKGEPKSIDIRDCIKLALFPFAMQQVFGYVPEKLHVKELGILDTWQIFDILVVDPLKTVIEVDWRNFFPLLSWIPNLLEERVESVHLRKLWVVGALIEEQRRILKTRAPTKCYADILLTEATHLSPIQLLHMVWEPIIESSDTTLVTTEWALYELSKRPELQERLHDEINSVVGKRMVNEDDIQHLPLLNAILKETLRKYPPVPILPPRYVREDITIGGYDIPKDWDVLINIYGINLDREVWADPESWDPERCLHDEDLDLGMKDFRILPFGAGKRMCAGITQAMLIIPTNVAALIQHFRLSPLPDSPEEGKSHDEDTVYLTTHKLHPLRAIVEPRRTERLSSSSQAQTPVCPAR